MSETLTEKQLAKREANAKQRDKRRNYIKQNYHKILLRFRTDTERDIIDHLNSKSSQTDYIRNLIRKDMEE